MKLGSSDIINAMDLGFIVCDPRPTKIEATHIDVHLGAHYWIPSSLYYQGGIREIATLDPKSIYSQFFAGNGLVILPPLSMSLCHTQEYIGTTVPFLTSQLNTRSTLARWGLTTHLTAGIGDPGYCSRWTLEVANFNNFQVAVPVGSRIAMVSFEQVSGNLFEYTDRYNIDPSEWTPDAMLPRKDNLV